jgi:pimeloyl-ACP methyl ester carboxylesterase
MRRVAIGSMTGLLLGLAGAPPAAEARAPALAKCTIVHLSAGGFVDHSGSPNIKHLRDAGARVLTHTYPLNSVAAAYASVARPKSVLFGESAGGSVAAWAAAHRRARAAVTVGAPLDFRAWHPSPEVFGGTPWKWSPQRVYRAQRPVTTIHWTGDPFVPIEAAGRLAGARHVTLKGLGHYGLPRRVLIRELKRACAL